MSDAGAIDRYADLEGLVAQGLSAAAIARKLKTTELAVVGQCARRGLTLGAKPPAPAIKAGGSTPRPLRTAPFDQFTHDGEPTPAALPPAAAWDPLPDSTPAPLIGLKAYGLCRWPVGEPEAPALQLACALPCGDSAAYCREHARRARAPRVKKRTDAGAAP